MEPLVNIRLRGGGGTHQVPLSEVNDYVSKLRQTYRPLIDRAKRIEAHLKARRGDDGYQVGGDIGIRDVLSQASQWLSESAPSEEAVKEFGQDITPIWGDLRALGRAKEMIETPIDPTQFIRNGEFDLQAYNKAHYDKGAELGLELTAGVPILGLGAAGLKFALKDGRLLNVIADEAGRTTMRNQLGMITWQGSPHKYDGRLDPTKIGTGEGAQAYGYGHYLAENPSVAIAYKNALSGKTNVPKEYEIKIKNAYLNDEKNKAFVGAIKDIIQSEKLKFGDFETLKKNKIKELGNSIPSDRMQDAIDKLSSLSKSDIEMLEPGSLYKFDLDDNAIANMLDWDAPLSEQPEAVRNALMSDPFIVEQIDKQRKWREEMLKGRMQGQFSTITADDFDRIREPKGEDIYNMRWTTDDNLNEMFETGLASRKLRELGIPGIKYYDGSSRAAGEGTRNFVLFPGGESLAEPLERNGVPFKK